MKNMLFFLILLITSHLQAQYYYNDIVGTLETNRQMKLYADNKVKTVSGSGVDNRGAKSTEYSEFHEVRENSRALKSTSIINFNKTVIYSRFDEQLRVTSMSDSSHSIASITSYTYDAGGRVSLVKNTVKDSANDFNQEEVHQWVYNAAGKPLKMWRIITVSGASSSIDSMEVRFVADESGNPGEERTFKRGVEMGYIYYYYDEKGRLSDVVRYNKKLGSLVPDIMFEYDDQDRVAQKTTTTSSINTGNSKWKYLGNLKWRYIYNPAGLKTKEVLFLNKERSANGRIDYTYTFFQ